MEIFIFIIFGIVIVFFSSINQETTTVKKRRYRWLKPQRAFPKAWRRILVEYVAFYNALSPEEQKWFEYKVNEFLLNCKIVGVNITIDDTDRVLVASSAIIPIFKFKNWKYLNLKIVKIYPSDISIKINGSKQDVVGLVGRGYMEGKMLLSREALRYGFQNEMDKKNTAIHEFVHLIDKIDGSIDGIPRLLLKQQYTIPWIDLIKQKIDEIKKNESDIDPYGSMNRVEFFSVASEYFFERPKLLEKNHPELYKLLEQIFRHDLKSRDLKNDKLME